MFSIVRRRPTPEEYLELRDAVGWRLPPAASVPDALGRSQWSVCAEEDGQTIGMGRVVGDGYYAFVVDVVVLPAHQHSGVGSAIIRELERMAASRPGVPRLQLVAAEEVVPFYEVQGYRRSTSTLLEKGLGG